MGKILHADFGLLRSADESADPRALRSTILEMSLFLGRWTDLPVRVRRRGSDWTAAASGTPFRMVLAVGLYPMIGPMPPGEDALSWARRRREAPREVILDASVDAEWLRDPTTANERARFGDERREARFSSLDEALSWVEAECLRAPVARASAAEVAEWGRRTVAVRGGRRVVFLEAVRTFGATYGDAISESDLVEKHGLGRADAESVCRVVRRVVLRKRSEVSG